MNPWLEVQLEDYEAHMASASIGQAQFLAQTLGLLVQECRVEIEAYEALLVSREFSQNDAKLEL